MKVVLRLVTIGLLAMVSGCHHHIPGQYLISKPEQRAHIETIRVLFSTKPNTETLIPKLKSAFSRLKSKYPVDGQPAILEVRILNFVDGDAGDAFLAGAINSITFAISVFDKKSGIQIYEHHHTKGGRSHFGGIVGVIREDTRDDELQLSRHVVKKIRSTVIKFNKMGISPQAVDSLTIDILRPAISGEKDKTKPLATQQTN